MGYVKELRDLVGNRPLVIAGACVLIVDKSGQLLLLKRTDNDAWGLPGGSLEPGETLEDCAKREALEEARLSLGDMKLLGVFSGPELFYEYPHGDQVHNVVIAFVCSDYGGDAQPCGQETNEMRFYAPGSLAENINPPDRPVIAAWLNACQ